MRLATKTATALRWSAISQLLRQGVQLITTFALARLLSPADFGLLGMALVIIGFVSLFRDLGTSSAVIRSRRRDNELLSTVFWLNLTLGLIITIVLVLSAPAVAAFYHEPRVTAVIQVLAFSLIVSSFGLLQQALLERELAFQTLAKVEALSVTLGAAVGIGLAAAGYGVWSLVFQTLAQTTAWSLLLWAVGKWRPGFTFRLREVRYVSGIGLNLTGFNTVNYFFRNIDSLLVGRYLGSNNLGFYSMAYRVMFFPLQAISDVMGRVMFPVYAHLQDDDTRLRRYYLKSAGAIAFVTFPMMLGLMVVAEPFVVALFGEKWRSIIPLLQILAPVGMIQSVGTTVGAIYVVRGRTDLMLRWGLIAAMVVTAAVVIGLGWGVQGVALSYAIAAFILAYPGFVIPFRLIGLAFTELVAVIFRPLLNSMLMATIMLAVRGLLPSDTGAIFSLIASILVGTCVYVLLSRWLNHAQWREIVAALRQRN